MAGNEKSTPESREKEQKEITEYVTKKQREQAKEQRKDAKAMRDEAKTMRNKTRKTAKREDVNQAAFRVVRESTEG